MILDTVYIRCMLSLFFCLFLFAMFIISSMRGINSAPPQKKKHQMTVPFGFSSSSS